MSSIRKLLRMGIPMVLVAGMAGCQYEGATAVSIDIERDDTPVIVESLLREETLYQSLTTVSSRVLSAEETVWRITPAHRDYVSEYKQQNADVVGWLYIPDTNINDPIVQNPTQNNYFQLKNDYYLNTDFYGNPSRDGTYCADYRATFEGGRAGLSRLTALYGHSWDDNPDGNLFSQLKKYRDPEFAREHPYIFFSVEEEDMAWEVFAVFDTTTSLPYIRPNLPLSKYQQTLDMIYDLTYYSYDVAVGDNDHILVLSTCTYSVAGYPSLPAPNDYRFVVMAKLVPAISPRKAEAVFAVNDSRLPPDVSRRLSNL